MHDRRQPARATFAILCTLLLAIGCGTQTQTPPEAPLVARQITKLPGFESHAEIAPDGRRVAFSRSPPDVEGIALWQVDLDSGELKQLTDPGGVTDVGATWSADGRRLYFGRYRERNCTIVELTLEGGAERELGACGRNVTGDFDVSPEGKWLAFSDRASDDEPYAIQLLELSTGERHTLAAPQEQSWGDRDPSFSPDGRQVAFTRSTDSERQDVWRVPIEGGAPVQITHDACSVQGHSWEPEGDAIVVSSRRAASRGLWRVPLDGGEARRLPVQTGHAWRPSRSATGPLVFENRVRQSAIIHVPMKDAEKLTPILISKAEDLDPQFSPDGDTIAFVSNRSGHFEIWTAELGQRPVQRTALESAFSGNPHWSPDSTQLVFDSRSDGQADLYLLDLTAADGEPRRLTQDASDELAPSFSADGTRIYFGSNRGGSWNVWSIDPDGGDARRVTENGGYIAIENGEGSRLYYTKYGESGLFERTAANGVERLVPGSEGLIGHEIWDVFDNDLYMVVREDRVRLIRIGADDARELIYESASSRLVAGLAVAPNAGHVLVSRITSEAADLWAVDF